MDRRNAVRVLGLGGLGAMSGARSRWSAVQTGGNQLADRTGGSGGAEVR